ncbi:MAG: hypothetical protein RXR32_03465 [Candidatus Micrarchaeota archaeon]
MKSFLIVLLLLLASLSYAANLTSCISPSLVACPAGATVHNIGSCPNGFVLWGCQYPNGTIVSTALPNATTTIASTIPPAAVTNTTASVANVSTTSIVSLPATIPAISAPSSNSAMLLYFSIAIVIVIILILYYVLISRKGMKASS